MADYSKYQESIIKRYYENRDRIAEQRLGELVTDLYLADSKKKQDRLWKNAELAMKKVGLPDSRIAHLMEQRDVALLASLVKELNSKR